MSPVYVVMAWGDNMPDVPIAVALSLVEAAKYSTDMATKDARESGDSLEEYWTEQCEVDTGTFVAGDGYEGYSVHCVPLLLTEKA